MLVPDDRERVKASALQIVDCLFVILLDVRAAPLPSPVPLGCLICTACNPCFEAKYAGKL